MLTWGCLLTSLLGGLKGKPKASLFTKGKPGAAGFSSGVPSSDNRKQNNSTGGKVFLQTCCTSCHRMLPKKAMCSRASSATPTSRSQSCRIAHSKKRLNADSNANARTLGPSKGEPSEGQPNDRKPLGNVSLQIWKASRTRASRNKGAPHVPQNTSTAGNITNPPHQIPRSTLPYLSEL